MISARAIRPVLWIGAAYDVVLGAAVFCCHSAIYRFFAIDPANHLAYVQMPALFVVVLGVMQALAARRPEASREMILCVCLMKLSYAGVVFGHRLFGAIPGVWVVFAVCDIAFLLLYGGFLLSPRKGGV